MLVTNGKIFSKGRLIERDILIENSMIKTVGHVEQCDAEKVEERIDAKGMLILPGLIDVHVHMREPGDTYKEDFKTGSRAAIAGGITTVLDMPNNKLPIATAERLEEKQKLATNAICDVFCYMAATEDNFNEIKRANPLSLKIYLSKTTGNLLVRDKKAIARHFQNFNKKISVHAEGMDEITTLTSLVNNSRLHLAHATTEKEINAVKSAGGSTEVTPHHLFLSKKHEEKLGNLGWVKPPLRDETDRTALWSVLDKIDCIATDHAPHTLEDKKNGAYGFPGLETSLSLLLNAYNAGLIPLASVVQKMAVNPAALFGLNDRGEITDGKKADLVFIDIRQEWRVKGEELETKCKWSPFEGWKLKGKAKIVIKDGWVIYEDGEFMD